MFKRVILFLSLAGITTCSESPTIVAPQGASIETLRNIIQAKKAEHTLEFAFDIHKVLLHKKPSLQWKTFWEYPHKRYLLRCFFNIPLMLNLGSMVWQLFLNMLPAHLATYREVTAEQLICSFAHADEKELSQLFTTIVNTQRVEPAMMALVIELKQAGYPLRIASNIGKQTYLKLKPMLEAINENVFKYFDKDAHGMEGKTIDYTQSMVQKPDARYYTEYLDTYDPQRNKLIIFVDDKLINIHAAIAQGFLGIHFKNTAQLQQNLHELGVL